MEQFNKYYVDTLKNRYAQFTGRASRSEFWYFILFYAILSFVISLLDSVLGTNYTYEVISAGALPAADGQIAAAVTQKVGYLSIIFSLAMLIPSMAISIRRLHDTGKSGWWFLLVVIPIVNFIGFFVLLYFYVQESQAGENEYGPNPKEI